KRIILLTIAIFALAAGSAAALTEAEEWYDKGIDYVGEHEDEEAIKCFDKALELDPEYEDALRYKGYTLDDLGKYSEAIECYDKALEIDRGNTDLWKSKGFSYKSQGKYAEAIECFDKILEIDPEAIWAIGLTASVFEDQGKYTEAIVYYDKVLEVEQRDEEIWYNVGRCHSLLGDKEKAITNLEKAVELYSKLKEIAKGDEGFKAYWDDPDFLEIVGE
ncbi:MAG: tetratricopeptide repeat protein, partial [bacterium]|nr:tetratricopeptide repeat protein [bacterium]